MINIDRKCLSLPRHPAPSSPSTFASHDSRFVHGIMKMSPMYGETMTTTTTTTTTTTMVAMAMCETFTNILPSFVYVHGYARVRTQACQRGIARVCVHNLRYTHYLMAPTYVFAVSRSLREQSESLGHIGQVDPPLLSSYIFFSFVISFTYECVKMIDVYRHSLIPQCHSI